MAFSFNIVAQDFSANNYKVTESYGQLPLIPDEEVTITHSTVPDSVISGMSVTCSAGGITSDNQLWRSFELASHFGITDNFDVTSVQIGVEEATAGLGGTQPMTVNLYTTPTIFPPALVSDLTLIGTTTIEIPDQALTLYDIPVTGTASAGSELVVEISIPADIGDGNRFWLGANYFGQTADSWLSSTGCGLIWPPVTTASIGSPDAMWVMSVTGTVISTTFQLTVSVDDGWNMVSIPGLHPLNQSVNTWWFYRHMGAAVFKYAGGYQVVIEAIPGEGYWMKHAGDLTYNTGDEWPAGGIQAVTHNDINAASGWNMIGGYENSVPVGALTTTPPGLITGTIYEYSAGYNPATHIVPGYGYWVKMSSAGLIGGLSAPPLGKVSNPVAEYFQEDWGKIIITDNAGISYTLYAVKGEVDLNQFELPPLPPVGMFDIRYSSDRIAEDINSSVQSIEMSGLEYPITVSVEGMDIRLQDESGKDINENVKSGDQITISNSQINKLMVSGELIPDIYALEQNYPNPFNPSTKIRYSVPQSSKVVIKVFDILGNEIEKLIDEIKSTGSYEITWYTKNLPSGIYFYRIQAGSFVETKKMVLMK